MAPQREWFEKDYYKVLGVSPTATEKEITTAYRKLARENHPDANPGNSSAEDRFKDVSAAYEVVGNAERRKEYDEVREMVAHGGFGAGGRGGPGGFSGFPGGGMPGGFNFDGNLDDILGGLFGQQRGQQRQRQPRQETGVDLETDLHVSFRDVIKGVTTAITINSDAPCPECKGTRAAPGTYPRQCARCSGRGVVDENQGMFGFSRPCESCSGTGSVIDSPCPFCSGHGSVTKPTEIKMRIPAGTKDGAVLRVPKRGGLGPTGLRGDLFVRIHATPDPNFTRDGNNLRTSVTVDYPTAVFGGDVSVTTLDRDTVTIRVAPGTKSGATLRVRGRGVATGSATGDLLVKVSIDVPRSLNEEQSALLRAFADSLTTTNTPIDGPEPEGAA